MSPMPSFVRTVRQATSDPELLHTDRTPYLTIHETGVVNMVRGPVLDGDWMQRVRVTGGAPGEVRLQQTGIAVLPDTAYVAHVAVRADPTDTVYLEVTERDAGGNVIAVHRSQVAIDPEDPTLLWVAFVTQPDAAAVDFAVRGLTSGVMDVDAAVVAPGTEPGPLGGPNLLANGSFEVDSDGDGLADGWQVTSDGPAWTASLTSALWHWRTGFSYQDIPLQRPLPAKPLVLGFFLSNNPPLAGYSIAVYYAFYPTWDASKGANWYASFGAWVACDGEQVRVLNGFSFPVSIRYYVLREDAFS